MFLLFGVTEISRGMWNYHTLARAVDKGARLASVRGAGCNAPNTCSVTVGTIANTVANAAIGLPPTDLNVTLVSASGATVPCNPLNTCLNNTAVWPPMGSDRAVGANVTVRAEAEFRSAAAMFWPGSAPVRFGATTLPAASTHRIVF
jgi:hypothetical protein